MAYYNPQQEDSYYNPYNQTDQGSSVYSGLAGIAKSMATYILLQGVATSVAGVISKGIGSGVKSLVNSRFAPSFTKSMAPYLNRTKTPDISTVLKSIKPVRAIAAVGTKAIQPYRRALANRSRDLRALQPDKFAANKAIFTSTFKDAKTFTGVAGSLLYRHAIKGSVLMYGIDSALGNTEQQGIENKAVWDLPGHVMNYASYMKKNALAFTVMGSLVPVAKSIHGAIGTGARGYFDKNVAFRDKVIGFLSKVSRPNYGVKEELQDVLTPQFKQFQSAQEGNFVTKAVVNTKGAYGTFVQQMFTNARTYFTEAHRHIKHAVGDKNIVGGISKGKNEFVEKVLHDTRAIWNAKKEQARLGPDRGIAEIPGLSAFNVIRQLATKYSKPANSLENQGGVHLLDAVLKYNEQIKPKSFIGNVLRMSPAKVGDIYNTDYIRQTVGRISHYFPEKKTEPLVSAIANTYLGKSFFKKGRFHAEMDLFNPLKIASKVATKLAGVNFKFPIGIPPFGNNVSLAGILGFDTALSEPIHASLLEKNTTGFGLIVDSTNLKNPTGTGGRQRNSTPKNLKQIIADSFSREKADASDLSVAYIGRKFYAVNNNEILPLDTKETILKYSHPSIFGQAGEGKVSKLRNWYYHSAQENKGLDSLDYLSKEYERTHPIGLFAFMQKKFDWEVPRAAINFISGLRNKLKPGRIQLNGKLVDHNQKLVATAAEGIFGKDLYKDGLHDHIQALYSLYGQTSQEVTSLLKRPTVFNEIAEKSKARLLKNSDIMNNDSTFLDILKQNYKLLGDRIEPDNVFHRLMSNPEMKALTNTTIYNPREAKKHIVFQRLGRLSDLSAFDLLRTRYVSAMVDDPKSFMDAADNLLSKNLISDRQAKALKVHGYLSSMFDNSTNPINPHYVGYDQKATDMVKNVVDRYKNQHNVWLQDTIDYIADTDMRYPIRKYDVNRHLKGETFGAFKLAEEAKGVNDASPFVSFSIDPHGDLKYGSAISQVADVSLERLSNLIHDWTGLKKNPFKFGDGIAGHAKYLGTRMAQVAAGVFAYRTLDSLVAANPLFNRTALDAGMTGFIAENIASTHLLTSRVANIIGVGQTSRYLEGLMPGFTSSAPGAIVGAAMNWRGGPLGIIKGAFTGAIANRILSPLLPDMTKTYDQLKSEYSGETEVPIIDNKMWFLGSTPWQGRSVQGWSPNWYVRAKSNWKSTDTMYGSEFRKWLHEPIFPVGMSLGDFVDSYYNERNSYFSRPYPETGDWGEEFPLGLGPIIAGTIGRIMKPKKLMHKEFLQGHSFEPADKVSAINPPTYIESRGMMMTSTFNPRKFSQLSSWNGTIPYSSNKMFGQNLADKALDNFESAIGLAGFGLHTIREGLSSRPTVIPTLETAGRITSQSRSYYDLQMGGFGGLSEAARRFVNKPDWKRYGVNPIPNLLPEWVGDQFTKGDPYSKIVRGELRLPGCITPDTMVLTNKGLKKANDICIGDKTLTLKGFKEIEHIIPSYKNETIYEINPYSGLLVNVTGNHHVLAIKTKKCKYHKKENVNKRPCKPFQSKKLFCLDCNCNDYNDYNLDWYPVSELKSSDYLVLPKIEKTKTIKYIKTVDLLNNSNIERNDGKFKTYNYLNGKKRYNKTLTFPDKIIFNKDIMYFFGYYLAEGYINKPKKIKSGITLTVSLNELHILHRLQKTIKDNFNIDSHIYNCKSRKTCYDLRINSVILATVVYNLFGPNKHINYLFNNLIYLIAGLYDGDAHVSKEGIILTASKKYEYSTDILNALLYLGIPYSIRKKNNKVYLIKISLNKINKFLIFKKIKNITNCNSKSSTFIEEEKYLLVKIKSIIKKKYNGKVLDFQVKDEHNYTTSFIMHNSSYEKTHPNIKHTMPGRASAFGLPEEKIVQYFAGYLPPTEKETYDIFETGNEYHKRIQDWLASENMLIKAEHRVYDVKHDIVGHIDAIIRDGYGGKGRRALEIKTISEQGLLKLDGPKNENISQLNFYLHQMKMKKGSLLYVSRDNPANFKVFEVRYDPDRYSKDIEKLNRARSIVGQMLAKGKEETSYGHTYSWVDRLKIIADISPASKEFNEAKFIVQQQIKSGMLDEQDMKKYHDAIKYRKANLRKYETYPSRFRNKIFNPDTEVDIQSINENIKAAAEYSLPSRVIGSTWENFTNTNQFLINKFFAFKDPMEHYKQYQLYGKEFTPWTDPYGSFIAPGARTAFSQDDPIRGAFNWGMGAPYLLGGLPGGIYGAIAGGIYGAAHGMVRKLSNTTYVPENIDNERRINDYFDTLSFYRNKRMESLSVGLDRQKYKNQAHTTLEGLITEGGGFADFFKSVGYREKPYIESWLKETDPDRRSEILKLVPEKLSHALQGFWRSEESKEQTNKFVKFKSEPSAMSQRYTRQEMDPNIFLEDIKLKTIKNEGLNVHDFGLGWQEQMIRVQDNLDNIQSSNVSSNEFVPNVSDTSAIKGAIHALLKGQRYKLNVFINNHSEDNNSLTVIIQRGKLQSLKSALSFRKKWVKSER